MTHSTLKFRGLRALLCLAVAGFAAIGCGGGVGSGGTGSPVQAFSQGPISGFGSIVVNGVHYDETHAAVTDDDGNALPTTGLKLGTTVDVQADAVVSNAATASAIRVHTDLVGPVTAAFDPATGLLAVMGQPVVVNAATALDAFASGAAGIGVGGIVAVSSLYDPATGVYVATRIDPDASASAYATRGAVAALDTAAHAFTIGTQVFDYGGAAAPAGLANGQIVRVRTLTSATPAGHWVVTTFGAGVTVPPSGYDGDLKGVVGSVTDATHFVVAGIPVDASSTTISPTGAVIAVQARLEVHGKMVAGVLVATTVEVSAEHDNEDDQGGGGDGGGIEIDGPILTPVDTVNHTFGVRGPTTIDYTGAAFSNGTAADLATGVVVEIQGKLSADGTAVVASQIKFDH